MRGTRGIALRPGGRTWSMGAAAVMLFAVGANVQAGWLFVLGACILGTALAGLLLPRRAVSPVELRRLLPASAREGEGVQVRLEVINRSRKPRADIEGTDLISAPAGFLVPALGGRATVALRYEVAFGHRGVFEGGPVRISSRWPFGIATATRTIRVPSRVIVHPRWVDLAGFPVLEAASVPSEHLHERRRRGGGLDFFGIREYRAGDSLRHVHWRSSARGGRLLVREFEDQPSTRMGILLDSGESPPEAFEDAVRVAASLALYCMDSGHPVQLACDSLEGLRRLFEPGRAEVLDWLASVRADGRRHLGRVAEDMVGEVQRRSTTAMIFASTRRNAAEALKAASILQERSARVVAIVASARSYEPARGRDVLGPPEEEELLSALEAQRCIVYSVGAGEDLSRCLSEPRSA